MFIYFICTPYLVEAPFALITASIWRGMEVISWLQGNGFLTQDLHLKLHQRCSAVFLQTSQVLPH